MLRASHAALGLFVLAACSSDPNEPPPDEQDTRAPFPAASGSELSATLREVVLAGVAPGVSAAVDHPRYRRWSGTSGVANLESGARLTPASRFRAGSMLKLAVATAVLQLVERGEVDLDDPLTAVLPRDVTDRIPEAEAITVRMLLAHRSGLPEFSTPEFDLLVLENPARVWTFDELLAFSLAEERPFAPGAAFSYTNTGYILLGRILEEATGEPWRKTVRERIFARARLASSALPEEGDPRCHGCSRGYESIDGELVDLTEVDPSMAGAAGGDALVTTPEDLVKLLRALSSGELFDDPRTLDLMLEFGDAPVPEEAMTGYGLGIARFEVGETVLYGHLGGTAGFHGFVLFHPPSGIVTSGIMNTRGDLGGFVIPVLDAVSRVE